MFFSPYLCAAMKNKKWLLLLIIVFPSLFWVILETSTINSNKLFYYGPRIAKGPKDTLFYTIEDQFITTASADSSLSHPFAAKPADYGTYAIMFIKHAYDNDSYRLAGLWEYLNYKKEKLEHIPLLLVTEKKEGEAAIHRALEKFTENKNVRFLTLGQPAFDSINKLFFKEKPIHIDYSFFALIDAERHIRGYYDARYVAEVKRLIDEYKHLKIKEEKEKLIDSNEIKSKP